MPPHQLFYFDGARLLLVDAVGSGLQRFREHRDIGATVCENRPGRVLCCWKDGERQSGFLLNRSLLASSSQR